MPEVTHTTPPLSQLAEDEKLLQSSVRAFAEVTRWRSRRSTRGGSASAHRWSASHRAQGAFDHTLAYIQERKQFDRPISDFQAVQFQIAQAATELEVARLAVYNCCGDRLRPDHLGRDDHPLHL